MFLEGTGAASTLWNYGPTAGAQKLQARLINKGANPIVFDSETVTVIATADTPSQLVAVAGDKQTGAAGSTLLQQLVVQTTDQYGNATGQNVSYSATPSTGTVTGRCLTPDCSSFGYNWTLGALAGPATLNVAAKVFNPSTNTFSSIGNPVTFTTTIGAARAKNLIAISQTSYGTLPAGATIAAGTAPAVRVTDSLGNAVPNVSVTFIPSNSGNVNGFASFPTMTDMNGNATAGAWTLGTSAGPNTVTVSSGTLSGSPLVFTATGLPGRAVQLVKFAGDGQSATVGQSVATSPQVRALDQYGNSVPGTIINFAVQSGGGSIVTAGPTTGATGVADAGGWTLGTAAGLNSLTASIPGALSAVTFTATAQAAQASSITKTAGDGQTAAVNRIVPIAPTVLVSDRFNNPVQGATVTFAVTGGGGMATGLTAQTRADGTASVGSWVLGSSASTNTLTASVSGIPSVSFTATATGPSLNIVNYAGDAQQQLVGSTLSTPPAVRVTDLAGNPVAGITVTFAVTAGAGSITGATAITDSNGVAAVGSWTLGSTPGTNELQASFDTGTSRGYTVFVATGT